MFTLVRKQTLTAVVTMASLFCVAGEAPAATQCANHDDITKVLTTKYKETRHYLGIVNSRMVMEIFMSPQGTWTILVTDTNGTACITAAGEEWQDAPVAEAGFGS